METTEKLLEISDVHHLVERLSDILQKSIVLENKQFELIAYSSPKESSFDPVQQKTILAKRCPLFVIERLKKDGIINQLKQNSQPIRIPKMEDIDFNERIALSLTYAEELCGYLWINADDKQLEERDLTVLQEMTPHLAKILYVEEKMTEQNPQQTIWKIINGEFVSDAEIHQAARMTSFYIPDEFNVMIGSIKDPSYLTVLNKMRAVFEAEEVAYYLGKGTEIIGIIDSNHHISCQEKSDIIIEKTMQTLTEEERHTFLIGIGNVYRKFNQLRKSYLEALEVIETMFFLNKKQKSKFSFQQLGIFRYIKSIYHKNVSEQYRNQVITILMKKDAENNSELIKTLWYYLENDCKVGQTAQQLFIHPNTLNYRIKQIVELTNINLLDVHEKAELYVQLLILNHVPDYQEYYKRIIY